MKAYLFWYKSDEYATTEYIYIIAYSYKQACFYFKKYGYTNMYDYDETPIDEVYEADFINKHQVGDTLGQYAIIWANTTKYN